MARAFYHDLYVVVPGPFRQFAESNQFFNLGCIGRVMGTTGTAGIAQAQSDVVFFADVEEAVIVFIERIFLLVHFHPGKEQGAATGYDIGQTGIAFDPFCRFLIHATMDSHEVYAIFSMLFDDGEKFFYRNIL